MEQLASQGDPDALNVVSFERDLEEMFQEVPDLLQSLFSYHEARAKIPERKRSRGFWPLSKGAGKFQILPQGFGQRQFALEDCQDLLQGMR